MELTDKQQQRYSRHIQLEDVGPAGQLKLLQAKVLLIGAGGLGSPCAFYLAAAGVGTIGIADGDKVELSNLQRQILHFTRDLGKAKPLSAREKLKALNPGVEIIPYHEHVSDHNIKDIITQLDYNFIIDATDNFETKFLINDSCVQLGKPFSHGGVLRFEGQTMTYLPGHTCYRCVFKTPPPSSMRSTCSHAGILGAVTGILGTIQATEVLKHITGCGELLTDRLLTFDAKGMRFRTLPVSPAPGCPACSASST